MQHVVTWKWTQPGVRAQSVYTSEHVNVFHSMMKRNTPKMEYKLWCITDDETDIHPEVECFPLWRDLDQLKNASGAHLPSCYRRLRLFDPATQKEMGIKPGDRITWIDLDAVIVGDMRHVFKRTERFVGWAVRGVRHLRVFNGSIVQFSAGDLEEIWKDFNPDTSPETAKRHGYFGSDQSWISFKLAKRIDCAGFGYPHVLSYPNELQRRPIVPNNASIVFFHGAKKPWHDNVKRFSPWVEKHWK